MVYDQDRLPKLSSQEIAALVRDFEVAEEKTSTVRYIAKLNYHFKDQEVRNLLKDYGIPFAETASKPVLVVPVYEDAGAQLLWDEPNPWREAWNGIATGEGLVPFALPLGDLADIASIGASQAINGDVDRLSGLAKRYAASDSIVAYAVHGIGAEGVSQVEVSVTRFGATQMEQTHILNLRASPGEMRTDLLRRAALQVVREVENQWKRDNLLEFGNRAVLAIAVPITGLKDWIDVKERLSGVAVVNEIDLVLMTRNEVRVNLHYIGELEQLTLALSQKDLGLFGEEGNWVLSKARRPNEASQ